MSKLKPLYVYCHYVVDDVVEIPVTIMYSEVQTFETDALINKIAEKMESDSYHYFYFQESGESDE